MSWRLAIALGLGAVLGLMTVFWGGVPAFQAARRETVPAPPRVLVPAQWRELRSGYLHRVHVAEVQVDCATCHGKDALGRPPQRVCVTCHSVQAQVVHGVRRNPRATLAGGAVPSPDAVSESDDAPIRGVAEGRSPGPPGECLLCHKFEQSTAQSRWDCVRCHGGPTDPPGALAVHGQVECGECHRPHGPTTILEANCGECHDAELAAKAAEHGCADCHRPHQAANRARDACQQCHQSQQGATAGGHDRCEQCHEPHRLAEDASRSCARCHQDSADLPAHGGGAACIRCHDPHGGPQAECATCHATQQAAVAGQVGHAERCSACHQEHPHLVGLAASTASEACAQCHQTQVRTGPVGHQQCLSCHQPHSMAVAAEACRACHGPLVQAARVGHRQCGQCHRPHEGLASAQERGGSCADCHGEMATKLHGTLAAGCTPCHDVHGPAAARDARGAERLAMEGRADCQGCHQAQQPGLHGIAGHQACGRCHGRAAHERESWAARATCLACHESQAQHEPEADTCQGCHVFRQ